MNLALFQPGSNLRWVVGRVELRLRSPNDRYTKPIFDKRDLGKVFKGPILWPTTRTSEWRDIILENFSRGNRLASLCVSSAFPSSIFFCLCSFLKKSRISTDFKVFPFWRKRAPLWVTDSQSLSSERRKDERPRVKQEGEVDGRRPIG